MAESGEQPNTRDEILAHAHALFCHYGFSKTNMSEIAGRCGMSTANLYRYFRNKQAIGLAVVGTHFADARREIEAALAAAGPDPEARIRAILSAGVRHIVSEMEANPRLIELADFVAADEEGWALLQRYFRWRRALIVEALEDGNRSGRFDVADPERTAIALQHAVKAFNLPFALARWRDRATVIPEFDEVVDLVFAGIRAKE